MTVKPIYAAANAQAEAAKVLEAQGRRPGADAPALARAASAHHEGAAVIEPEVDYASPGFSRGYADGYLGRPCAGDESAGYREGYITGEAEQDAPRDCVPADLYDQRRR